jgi:Kef-type K+ transport system membrane component KefB/CBS domain-containing protein
MDPLSSGILLIFGIGVFGGILGAWASQRMRVPQVVGYILMGVLLGETGLRLIQSADVENLRTFNVFALGIIGFLVGGELKAAEFRKYGRQYMGILLGEGVLAFALVGVPSALVVWLVLGDVKLAVAVGAVLGAVASATDPASTVGVLWEYRARGALTTAIVAIVALDDALAMTLYGIGTSVAKVLAGGEVGLGAEALRLLVELGGAVGVGALGGLLLVLLLRHSSQQERSLAMSLGIILMVIGVSNSFNMDVIMATMTMGIVVTNLAPRSVRDLFGLLRSFSTPIYVMFFVLVGARLSITAMPGWLWGIVAIYVVGRTAGKYFGAYYGALATGAEPVVRANCGLGLFAQGGVAVGLSIMAGQHLEGIPVTAGLNAGDLIVYVVTTTTLIVQIIGPPMVKLAVHRASEAGRDVTEEDVVASLTVGDVMSRDTVLVPESEPVRRVLQMFSEHDALVYPVVDEVGRLRGILPLETLKDILPERDTWDWLVAGDVCAPHAETVRADTPLAEALQRMRDTGLEQLPVVAPGDSGKPEGILDRRLASVRVKEEVVRRQYGITK